jgi:hypothetical protein
VFLSLLGLALLALPIYLYQRGSDKT